MSKKQKKLRKEQEKREKRWAKQRKKRGYADIDVWSIDSWFMNLMPRMLEQLKKTVHGYPAELGEDGADGMEKWKGILSRMIQLLNDMDEGTCSMKNQYEEEYLKAREEFIKKYGRCGKKLRIEEDKMTQKATGAIRVYMPDDVPEYEEISRKYSEEIMKIDEYRNQCKDEFFKLFSEYFWNLWD